MVSVDPPQWAGIQIGRAVPKKKLDGVCGVPPDMRAAELTRGTVLLFRTHPNHYDDVVLIWMDRKHPTKDLWLVIAATTCIIPTLEACDVRIPRLDNKAAHCDIAAWLPRNLAQRFGAYLTTLRDEQMSGIQTMFDAMMAGDVSPRTDSNILKDDYALYLYGQAVILFFLVQRMHGQWCDFPH